MSYIISDELENMRLRLVKEVKAEVDTIFSIVEKQILAALAKNCLYIKDIVEYPYVNSTKSEMFAHELGFRIGNNAEIHTKYTNGNTLCSHSVTLQLRKMHISEVGGMSSTSVF